MNILRKIFLGLLAFILPLLLLGLAWSFTGSRTLGNRDAVTGWIDDSGAYDKTVDALLESIKQGQQEGPGQEPTSAEGININDPKIQAIAKQAFSSEFLKTSFENFLNGIYDYLEGKSTSPAFQINVGAVKSQLANGLSTYVVERTRSLPVCSRGEIPETLDVYNATCLPPGTSAEQAGQLASNEILNSSEFLPNEIYTADNIKLKDENGQEIPLSQAEQLENIKRAYTLSRALPIIFSILSLLLAAGIILLTPDRQQGFKRVAKISIGVAITLGLSYLLLDKGSVWLSDRLRNQDVNNSGEILGIMGDILKTAAQDAAKYLLWFAVGYLVVGVGIYIAIKLMDRKNTPEPQKPAETTPAPETENKPAPNENKTTKHESTKN